MMCVARAMARSVSALLLLLLLPGCINEKVVTTRPEYAYPQNLLSLCGKEKVMNLANKGHFVTADFTNHGFELLLSPQLFPLPPEVHRRVASLRIIAKSGQVMTAIVTYYDGKQFSYAPPESMMHCNDQGEMIVTYPSNTFYFWASVGNKTRELALWTNSDADLIVHNRWKETHRGLVGGEIDGDAWAVFRRIDAVEVPVAEVRSLEKSLTDSETVRQCAALTGDFVTEGEAISADGTVNSRTAADHFFREEIFGINPVNQQKKSTTVLKVVQDDTNGISLNLYGAEGLLATRVMKRSEISCDKGKWQYEGEIKAHSAWLLVAASAGVYWENMSLWRDENGDLLVSGTYKSRGALLLVPFGRTEHTFVAFAEVARFDAERKKAAQESITSESIRLKAELPTTTPTPDQAASRRDKLATVDNPTIACSALRKTASYEASRICYLNIAENKRFSNQFRVEASFSLGLIYELGLGVQEDLDIAKEWYRKAGLIDGTQ